MPVTLAAPLFDHLSPRARLAPESGIVEVVNYARGREGLIPLWVGEGDRPTPAFIRAAAMASLDEGETFYTWQRGIPELRDALSRYYARIFSAAVPSDSIFVVGSGMQAIQLALQAFVAPGDDVVSLTPAWPNFAAAAEIAGARHLSVPLDYAGGRWSLDKDRLADTITERTRVLFVNTPSNPTGWTASRADLADLLALAKARDLVIVADEIYAQFHYAGGRAPSFLDVMQPDDPVVFVNSFSKNWSMTGWRAGWIVAPSACGQVFENLIQYSTSGVATFIQRGCVAALEAGDEDVRDNIARATLARDILCEALTATNRVETLKPDGAFYAFLTIDGVTDTRAAAIDIVDRTGVGLAPGSAFGAGGGPFLRACFLRDPDEIRRAADRLATYIRAL